MALKLLGFRVFLACLMLGIAAALIAPTGVRAETDELIFSEASEAPGKDALAATEATLEVAEFNYRARRLTVAMEQFGMVAAMQNHPFAWLRIGNICHRRGDASGALDAYQRAAKAASQSPQHAHLGHRAIMNQALLGLDQTQLALEALGMKGTGAADHHWLDEMQLRLEELSAAIPAVAVTDGQP